MDGDADRLVYFTRSGDTLILLDGNKIAALAADFIQDTLQNIPEIASETKVGEYQDTILVAMLGTISRRTLSDFPWSSGSSTRGCLADHGF